MVRKNNKIIYKIILIINILLFVLINFFVHSFPNYKYFRLTCYGGIILFMIYFFCVFLQQLVFYKMSWKVLKSLSIFPLMLLFFLQLMMPVTISFSSKTNELKNYMQFDNNVYEENRFKYILSNGITYFPKEINKNEVDNEYYYYYSTHWSNNIRVLLIEKYHNLNKFEEVKNLLIAQDYVEVKEENNNLLLIINIVPPRSPTSNHPVECNLIAINSKESKIMYIYENDYDYEFSWVDSLLNQKDNSNIFDSIPNTCTIN